MTNIITDTSQRKPAKLLGILFLLSLIVPLFYGAFLFPKLTVDENVMATASNIMTNELLLRIGIASQLFMSGVAAILAVMLYNTIQNAVNKSLALLALFWNLQMP